MPEIDTVKLVRLLKDSRARVEPELNGGTAYILEVARRLTKGPVALAEIDFGRFAENDLANFRRLVLEPGERRAHKTRNLSDALKAAKPCTGPGGFI